MEIIRDNFKDLNTAITELREVSMFQKAEKAEMALLKAGYLIANMIDKIEELEKKINDK